MTEEVLPSGDISKKPWIYHFDDRSFYSNFLSEMAQTKKEINSLFCISELIKLSKDLQTNNPIIKMVYVVKIWVFGLQRELNEIEKRKYVPEKIIRFHREQLRKMNDGCLQITKINSFGVKT